MSLSDGQYDFPQAQGAKAVNGTAPEAAGADHAEYDAPAARSAVAPLKAASLYDKPPNQQQQTHQKLDMSTFKVCRMRSHLLAETGCASGGT